MVCRILATHTDELVPRDTQLGRVTTHVLAKQGLVEIVVAGRNGSVNGIERRSAYQLHSLIECQPLVYVVTETLQVAECSMTLIAVINLFLDAQLLQGEDTTDTQQNLLLETVLPITTIE